MDPQNPESPQRQRNDARAEARRGKAPSLAVLQKRLEQNKAQLLVAIESVRNRPDELACADRAQWVLDKLREQPGAAQAIPATSTNVRPSTAPIAAAPHPTRISTAVPMHSARYFLDADCCIGTPINVLGMIRLD